MWTIIDSVNNTTNKVTAPTEGIISVTKPDSVQVKAYVNDLISAVHHVHVNAGDVVHFELQNTAPEDTSIQFDYAGTSTSILVPGNGTQSTHSAEGKIMADDMNYFGGGGLMGAVIGSQLFGDRDRNRNNDEGYVTPSFLAASLATVQANVHNTGIQQVLGDIKAAIPLAEGQVQLALAGNQANLVSLLNTNAVADALASANTDRAINDASAVSLAAQSTIRAEALVAAGKLEAALLQNKFDITQVTRDEGDKTRRLIEEKNDAVLNRELAVAQSALLEARSVARENVGNTTITNTLTANQAQSQSQAQQQQQFQILANLNACVQNLAHDMQVVRQTQSNVNFGVQGTAGQTATAANTRVN